MRRRVSAALRALSFRASGLLAASASRMASRCASGSRLATALRARLPPLLGRPPAPRPRAPSAAAPRAPRGRGLRRPLAAPAPASALAAPFSAGLRSPSLRAPSSPPPSAPPRCASAGPRPCPSPSSPPRLSPCASAPRAPSPATAAAPRPAPPRAGRRGHAVARGTHRRAPLSAFTSVPLALVRPWSVPVGPMSDPDAHLVAMSVVEAATALGLSTEAVRKRVRRGHLEVRTGNDGRKLVLVPRSEIESVNGPDKVQTDEEAVSVLRSEIVRLVSERDRAKQDAEEWRVKAEAARLDSVRSESGLTAAKEPCPGARDSGPAAARAGRAAPPVVAEVAAVGLGHVNRRLPSLSVAGVPRPAARASSPPCWPRTTAHTQTGQGDQSANWRFERGGQMQKAHLSPLHEGRPRTTVSDISVTAPHICRI